MTDKIEQMEQLARLGRLLDAYGSRTERWPAAAGDDMQRLMASSADARALAEDARAFDRALDLAGQSVGVADQGAVDRIMAQALTVAPVPAANVQRGSQPSAQVIAMPRRNEAARTLSVIDRVARRQMAAALVAACLLAGIVLGGSVRIEHILQDVADAVGLPTEFETTTTALSEETGEEDAL